mgnify:CR=1 FL=1
MLYADKAALANRARLRMLQIRERELNLYIANSRVIATKSTLLCGIAYSALLYVKMDYYQGAHWFTRHVYPVALVILLGFSLLALMNFSLIAMLGPGARARGRRGDAIAAPASHARAPPPCARRPRAARARWLRRHRARCDCHRVPHRLILLCDCDRLGARRRDHVRLRKGRAKNQRGCHDQRDTHHAQRVLAALAVPPRDAHWRALSHRRGARAARWICDEGGNARPRCSASRPLRTSLRASRRAGASQVHTGAFTGPSDARPDSDSSQGARERRADGAAATLLASETVRSDARQYGGRGPEQQRAPPPSALLLPFGALAAGMGALSGSLRAAVTRRVDLGVACASRGAGVAQAGGGGAQPTGAGGESTWLGERNVAAGTAAIASTPPGAPGGEHPHSAAVGGPRVAGGSRGFGTESSTVSAGDGGVGVRARAAELACAGAPPGAALPAVASQAVASQAVASQTAHGTFVEPAGAAVAAHLPPGAQPLRDRLPDARYAEGPRSSAACQGGALPSAESAESAEYQVGPRGVGPPETVTAPRSLHGLASLQQALPTARLSVVVNDFQRRVQAALSTTPPGSATCCSAASGPCSSLPTPVRPDGAGAGCCEPRVVGPAPKTAAGSGTAAMH